MRRRWSIQSLCSSIVAEYPLFCFEARPDQRGTPDRNCPSFLGEAIKGLSTIVCLDSSTLSVATAVATETGTEYNQKVGLY